MTLLATEGLTKRYGGLTANDGVALTLEPGEIRGLIGPNGAGKTTFVNVVTGIERPDAGTVMLGTVPITGLGAYQIAARGLVRSFQVARVFGNLTVHENLMVPYFANQRTRGAAFLIVSHEMEIIRRICPRVTVMIAGRVAAEGPLDEIARREEVITAYLGRSFQ